MRISAADKSAARSKDVRKSTAVDADLEYHTVVSDRCILDFQIKQISETDLSSTRGNGKGRRDQNGVTHRGDILRKCVVW